MIHFLITIRLRDGSFHLRRFEAENITGAVDEICKLVEMDFPSKTRSSIGIEALDAPPGEEVDILID